MIFTSYCFTNFSLLNKNCFYNKDTRKQFPKCLPLLYILFLMFSPPLFFLSKGKKKRKRETVEYRLNEIGEKQTNKTPKNKREQGENREKTWNRLKQQQTNQSAAGQRLTGSPPSTYSLSNPAVLSVVFSLLKKIGSLN